MCGQFHNDNMKLRGDLQSHFHKMQSLNEKVKELMIKMDLKESESESAEEEESDDDVVVVEKGPVTKLESIEASQGQIKTSQL